MRQGSSPPPRIELGSEMSQVSEVNEYILQSIPPFPSLILCLKRKLVNINFIWAFENLNFQVGVGDFQHTPTKHVKPKNEKLDLGILCHLEQLLGLGWVISVYPPTMNVAPKNKKLDLGILQPLEQLLGLGWVISTYVQP